MVPILPANILPSLRRMTGSHKLMPIIISHVHLIPVTRRIHVEGPEPFPPGPSNLNLEFSIKMDYERDRRTIANSGRLIEPVGIDENSTPPLNGCGGCVEGSPRLFRLLHSVQGRHRPQL